jgi:Uncharacterized protein conserved in bacteria
MNCPKCDANISFKKRQCDKCGQDLTVYKRIISASNILYNDGLTKAKVRDLSGAALSLRKSLKLNKKNTNARNLLGLVYYEMGETVAALSEWVLSKHFQADNNMADEYMNYIQSNPSRLDAISQAIKKYNSALISANQGSGDLAIIQLKKVVSLNPKFIRAYQLLGLLYLQTGEREKAEKCLKKARKIDVNNTTTLRYLNELHDDDMSVTQPEVEHVRERKVKEREEVSSYFPVSSYKEDKPNILAFINLILGVIIGVAVVYFLVVPTVRKNVAEEYKQNYNNYSSEQSANKGKMATLEKDKEDLQGQVKTLQDQLDQYKGSTSSEEMYTNLFDAVNLYIGGKKDEAAQALVKVDETTLDNDAAKKLYKTIKDDTFQSVSDTMFKDGRKAYNSGKYDEALKTLQSAIDMNPQNVDAIYFMGRTYHKMNNNDKAKEYYNKVIDEFPDSARVAEAKARLREIK